MENNSHYILVRKGQCDLVSEDEGDQEVIKKTHKFVKSQIASLDTGHWCQCGHWIN